MEQLELTVAPSNEAHFEALMSFCGTILAICRTIEVDPIATGSLVVLAYTQNPDVEVNDVDFACFESQFAQLREALAERGINSRTTDYHVLQAVDGDLKIDFDAREYWMRNLPTDYTLLKVAALTVKAVTKDALIELYRRGLEATAGSDDAHQIVKHQSIRHKLALLDDA